MACSVLLLLKRPEAFPCSPFLSCLFSSLWTEQEAKTILLQEENNTLQCQEGLCASSITPSVSIALPCADK